MTIFQNKNSSPGHHYIMRPLFFFFLGLVLILAYQNSLSSPFILDDYGNIVGNKYISINSLSFQEIKQVFSPHQNCANRKIANLSFALNYYFGKLNPTGYHFINILIHIVNTWLIFCLFQWYFKQVPLPKNWNTVILSGLAALWWSTNPIQTNAVTYIVQRMTSMSTMFCLASMHCYLLARTPASLHTASFYKKIFLFMIAAILWIFAMMSKEIAAILPLLIIAHEIYFFDFYKKFKANKKKYLIAIAVLSCLIVGEVLFFMGAAFWNNIIQGYNHRNFTLTDRLLTEPRVVFHYISLFLYPLPSRLSLYYDNFPVSSTLLSPYTTLPAIAGTFLWLYAIVALFKKNRLVSFGMLWVFLSLLVESTVIALELVFEHRFYLPSIGFVLSLTAALVWLLQNTGLKPAFLYCCIGALIGSQVIGTRARNLAWHDQITFSLDEIEKNPDSVRALTNLGWFLIKNGKMPLAEKPLKKALKLEENNIPALNDLFILYTNPPYKNYSVAEQYLQKIIAAVRNKKAKPTDTESLYNISHHLFRLERYNDCLLLLNQVSKFYGAPEVFLHIGQCNIQLKNYQKAINALNRALRLQPYSNEIKYYLALSYFLNDNKKEAIHIFRDIERDNVQDINLKKNIKNLADSLDIHQTAS